MPASITPDPKIRRLIEQKSTAGSNMCWTCGTCDFECPVYISAQRLNPQKIIRMANLGMLEALLTLPDIWYCLMCRRCHKGCPNAVKPFEVIEYIRQEAIQRGVVRADMLTRQRELVFRFQRVRWRSIEICRHGELADLPDEQWQQWLNEPVPPVVDAVKFGGELPSAHPGKSVADSSSQACYTCSECSGCCPIYSERPVFDPQFIIRMANLGLTDELIHSPSIWLCLRCEMCEGACSQKVRGHKVIRDLQELALERGVVGRGFMERFARAEHVLYSRLVVALDDLLKK